MNIDLDIKYMGLALKSPLIIGANPFTDKMDYLKTYEECGAGAIVYKTIFQEQVEKDNLLFDELIGEYGDRNAEMITIAPEREDTGIEDHIFKIIEIKKQIKIPLVVSFNCTNLESWISYAKAIEKAGADALQINLLFIPHDLKKSSNEIEAEQLQIVKSVVEAVKIPVNVKISPFYTNVHLFLDKLIELNVKGVVLFGKFLNFDINMNLNKIDARPYLSHKGENSNSLRTIGAYYKKQCKMSIVSTTGILNGMDVVKNILVGASAVELVSAILLEPENLSIIVDEIKTWMTKNGYSKIDDFKGLLSEEENENLKYTYNLVQYLDNKENISELLKRILV